MAHKDSTDGVELKGKMRIKNRFLESAVKFVTIVVKGSTPTIEMVSQALVKFDMEVSLAARRRMYLTSS